MKTQHGQNKYIFLLINLFKLIKLSNYFLKKILYDDSINKKHLYFIVAMRIHFFLEIPNRDIQYSK